MSNSRDLHEIEADYEYSQQCNAKLRADLAASRAEVERLRKAAIDVVDAYDTITHNGCEEPPWLIAIHDEVERLNAALDATPATERRGDKIDEQHERLVQLKYRKATARLVNAATEAVNWIDKDEGTREGELLAELQAALAKYATITKETS